MYLQDKWAKMKARNLKRFVTAVGGLSALELTRLVTKLKEALPRRYDADMLAALRQGQVRRIFTGGNAVVWPERYRQVGYYYEVEKDVFKLKPRGRALTHSLEQHTTTTATTAMRHLVGVAPGSSCFKLV